MVHNNSRISLFFCMITGWILIGDPKIRDVVDARHSGRIMTIQLNFTGDDGDDASLKRQNIRHGRSGHH